MTSTTSLSLWAGVVAMGLFHGLNPAMGWPLAVANGMSQRRSAAVLSTWLPLGAGHLLAMALVLMPFALLAWLLQWTQELRVGAAALVMAFGVWRLVDRRHPRVFARIRPTQLLLWSFLMATAHGAALMLLPMLMGLCRLPGPADTQVLAGEVFGHQGMAALMSSNLATALAVALVHSLAMVSAGLVAAWLVYRHFGLRALRATWFDLDRVWALCLIAAGGAACLMALAAAD